MFTAPNNRLLTCVWLYIYSQDLKKKKGNESRVAPSDQIALAPS